VNEIKSKGGGKMYPNLEAEIARKAITKTELADTIEMPRTTFTQKISGKFEFTVAEAKRIQERVFPEYSLEYLFKKRGE
jgi:hypothetical protein